MNRPFLLILLSFTLLLLQCNKDSNDFNSAIGIENHNNQDAFDRVKGLQQSTIAKDYVRAFKENNTELLTKLYPTKEEFYLIHNHRQGNTYEYDFVNKMQKKRVDSAIKVFNHYQTELQAIHLDHNKIEMGKVNYEFSDMENGTFYFTMKIEIFFEKTKRFLQIEAMKISKNNFKLETLPQLLKE